MKPVSRLDNRFVLPEIHNGTHIRHPSVRRYEREGCHEKVTITTYSPVRNPYRRRFDDPPTLMTPLVAASSPSTR